MTKVYLIRDIYENHYKDVGEVEDTTTAYATENLAQEALQRMAATELLNHANYLTKLPLNSPKVIATIEITPTRIYVDNGKMQHEIYIEEVEVVTELNK